jgi:hypothetical protein
MAHGWLRYGNVGNHRGAEQRARRTSGGCSSRCGPGRCARGRRVLTLSGGATFATVSLLLARTGIGLREGICPQVTATRE